MPYNNFFLVAALKSRMNTDIYIYIYIYIIYIYIYTHLNPLKYITRKHSAFEHICIYNMNYRYSCYIYIYVNDRSYTIYMYNTCI